MNLARTILLLIAFVEVWASGWAAAIGDLQTAALMVGTAASSLFLCAYLPETVAALRDVFTKEEP